MKKLNIDFNQDLNPEQLEVVFNGDGPCLVLAGAGSGKTRTLVYRVIYLLAQGVPASNIMLLTFTNKAAKEMLERINFVLGEEVKGFWGGTFHHIGNRLLRVYGQRMGIDNNFTILDEEDSLVLLKNIINQINPTDDKFFPKPKVIKSLFSLSINLCRDLDEVIDLRYDYFKPDYKYKLKQILEAYQQRKTITNSLDFDDLLLKWKDLLEKDHDLRLILGKKFQYILVDEYQDTNYLQNRIINNLSAPQNNVLVVGDDSQSIYGFRGADVNNILDFPQDFKDARIFHLSNNYRSTPEILALANSSINKNVRKFEKKLSAICSSGVKPLVFSATDNYEQASFVAKKILQLQQENNIELTDIAILFRSHFQSLEMEMELNKQGISYQMRGGLRFFEQAHLKDVVAYLKIINNFKDEVAWLRLLGMQSGIGLMTANKIWQKISLLDNLNEIINLELKLSSKALVGWQSLKNIFKKLLDIEKDDIESLLKIILKNGYERYLQSTFENYKERLEDLEQLIIFTASYKNLDNFLSDIALSENFRSQDKKNTIQTDNKKQVILSTIHQAKGLEWRVVFVIGLADGLFPSSRINDKPEEIEEERRLFYVAVTRAKEQLYLVYPLFSRENILQPSLFIKELPSNLYENLDLDSDSYFDNNEEVVYVDEDDDYRLSNKVKKKRLLNFDSNWDIGDLDF